LERFNNASPNDNFSKIITLSSQPIKTLK